MVLNSNTLDFLWLQDGEQGTPGADGSSLYTWVKYSQAADGSHMTDNPTDAVYIGIAYNKTSATESTNPEDYSWSKIKGENGDDGSDGEDAYTIILTNENVSFSTDKTNLPLTNQSATCGILVYKGATPITTYTIGRVTAPTGIGVSQTTNSIILSVSASVTVPNDNGQVQIPITIGAITVTKQIAYSLSKQGDDGRGISSTAVHYIASTNGVSPPPLTANWLNEIPVLQAGEYLWTRTTTNYTDGTSLYGYSVSKDGRGVATVTNEYKISKSNTNPDAGRSDGSVSNWNAVRPTDVGTDEYLWIRYKYTYDDGSTPTYSDAIYDSTIDGISSILDTENRTLKDTVWETAYFNVVDPDTGEVIQMNIKNTIVESVTDITGIEQRVSTTETNLGDFTNSEYTLFKQSVNQFQTEVTNNLNNTTTIATQTAEDFSWMFSKGVYDAYLVDEDGNYVIDENGNFIKAEKESPDGSARIVFTREGIDVVNGIVSIKAPNGETTIIEGGKINTNRIVSLDGTSWINLGLGTFNYGNKLTWNGAVLSVDGEIYARSGNITSGVTIGDVNGYHAVMDADSFDVFDSDGTTKLATFGKTSYIGNSGGYHVAIDSDSFDVFDSDGTTKLATFGKTSYIGNSGGYHVAIDSDSFDVLNGRTTLATFGAETIIGNLSTRGVRVSDDGFLFRANSNDAFTIGIDSRTGSTEETRNSTTYDLTRKVDGQTWYRIAQFASGESILRVSDGTPPWTLEPDEISIGVGNYLGYFTEDNYLWVAKNPTDDGTADRNGISYLVSGVIAQINNPYYCFGNAINTGGTYPAGKYGLSHGRNCYPAGAYSISSGNACVATKAYSFARGMDSWAKGEFAIACGNLCESNEDYGLAIGYQCKAMNYNTIAIGYKRNAYADGSISLGGCEYLDETITFDAVANRVGGYWHFTATGLESYIASIITSLDFGFIADVKKKSNLRYIRRIISTTQSSSGTFTVVFEMPVVLNNEWQENETVTFIINPSGSYGIGSLALGESIANGESTLALGDHTIALRKGALSIGAFNKISDAVFSIGNGDNDANRSNAFSVDTLGNVVAAGSVRTENDNIDNALLTVNSPFQLLYCNARKMGGFIFFSLEVYINAPFTANSPYVFGTIASSYVPKNFSEIGHGHTTDGTYNPKGSATWFAYNNGNMEFRLQSGDGPYVFLSGFYAYE